MQTAIQFYTLRELNEPLSRTFGRVNSTSLDGVEFGFNQVKSPAETATALENRDLELANLMAGVDDLEHPESGLADACEVLGCDTVVLGYLDASHFESVERVEETADTLSRIAQALDDHGLQFLYHNHDHEFADIDGRTAFDILLDRVDDRVGFELDLGWIGTGGDDPYARLESLADRTPSVHFKDMRFETGEFVTLGEGDLDLDRAVRTAREADVEWVIYENDEPDDPVTDLERGANRLVDAVRGA